MDSASLASLDTTLFKRHKRAHLNGTGGERIYVERHELRKDDSPLSSSPLGPSRKMSTPMRRPDSDSDDGGRGEVNDIAAAAAKSDGKEMEE